MKLVFCYTILFFSTALLLGGCAITGQPTGARHLLPDTEVVLFPGARIEVANKNGHISIEAGNGTFRRFIWEGATPQGEGKVEAAGNLLARQQRWYGRKGLYGELPADSSVGVSRMVVEEGQMYFDSIENATNWLAQAWNRESLDMIFSNDGFAVGCVITPHRQQINVLLVQIYVRGKKPVSLRGAQDRLIYRGVVPPTNH
jgi:hypothetical protein